MTERVAALADAGLIDEWEMRIVGQHTVYEISCDDWRAVKDTLRKYGLKEHQTSQPGARRIYDPTRDSVDPYQPS